MLSLNPHHATIHPKRSKQQLIVQINIGKRGQASEIRLSDINNMSCIEYQIRGFIKANGLKETAFSYIKEIIVKQIGQRREEIYRQSHSKCSKNCKCETKMQDFQEKEKRILGVITLNDSRRGENRSLEGKGKHLSIKITQKVSKPIDSKQDSSFVFNSSFTLPSSVGDKERILLTDQLYKHAFDPETTLNSKSTQFYETKQSMQSQQPTYSSNHFPRKIQIMHKPLQSSLSKNRMINQIPPIRLDKVESSLSLNDSGIHSCRKRKPISTRERKEAIMTPKKIKLNESKTAHIKLNSKSLEKMAEEHRHNLKEKNQKIIQKILESPLFPDRCIPPNYQAVIEALFAKLTQKNPPQMKQLHSEYVSYQHLSREQLQFMGALFQKINHTQLNNLNYGNFRSTALKYCWKELSELVQTCSSSRQ